MGGALIRVDAEQRFLQLSPARRIREKAQIIGRMFVEVFRGGSGEARGRELARAGNDLSGCDRIGGSKTGKALVIKSTTTWADCRNT